MRSPFTHEEIEAAALAMITNMFAPHELPVDEDLWNLYYATARDALNAAERAGGDGESARTAKEE